MDVDNSREITKEEKKEKVRKKYQCATTEGLEVIPAKPKIDFYEDTRAMRVAVYVRVSTDRTAQTSSFEMQQKYYSDMVARHPSWTLIETYADEGITGTSLKHRDAFIRMIEACERGEIDLIITKNVYRWARNILDGVGVVRKLADMKPPVGVYFENEGIYSLDPEKQTILSIYHTLSEQESRSKSVSMNSSIEMRFSHGLFLTPPLLGYDNDEEGNLIVNHDEADTVRLIFYLYLSGYSTEAISAKLMALGRKTKLGNSKWTPGTVVGVLKNERHCGAIYSRKTWTPNFLTHRSIKNRGEHTQYCKHGHHEKIISRDDFIAVQKMLSNAKYGGNTYLPKLKVNAEGALRGFVTVNPYWGAFTAEDYRKASTIAPPIKY
jgi:DNA invertase Pin-like site-specific DNA recombinase